MESRIEIIIIPYEGIEKINVIGGDSRSHREALDFYDMIEPEITKFDGKIKKADHFSNS